MKKLFVIFSLVFCVSGWAAEEDYFISLPENSYEQEGYLEGINAAKEFVSEGSRSLNSAGQTMAQKVISALNSAIIKVSDSTITSALCTSRSAGAFVNQRFLNTIFVCDGVRSRFQRQYTSREINILGQLFIHEGVHLTKNTDECIATYFEIGVMKNTSAGIQSRSNIERYSKQCNFQL